MIKQCFKSPDPANYEIEFNKYREEQVIRYRNSYNQKEYKIVTFKNIFEQDHQKFIRNWYSFIFFRPVNNQAYVFQKILQFTKDRNAQKNGLILIETTLRLSEF